LYSGEEPLLRYPIVKVALSLLTFAEEGFSRFDILDIIEFSLFSYSAIFGKSGGSGAGFSMEAADQSDGRAFGMAAMGG